MSFKRILVAGASRGIGLAVANFSVPLPLNYSSYLALTV